MPPLMGSTAPGGGLDANASPSGAGSPDQARAQLEDLMGKIRAVGQAFQDIGQQAPSMQDEVKQVQQILKRMVVKAAQQAPQQTGSAAALPTGG